MDNSVDTEYKNNINERVQELLNIPQYAQLSPEWFETRKTCITASSAASLLIRDEKTCKKYVETYNLQDIFNYDKKCCNPYSTKNQYYLDKCRGSKFKGNTATYWGQKYEQVASDIYSNITGYTVLEFGLLKHKTIEFLGASPDGVTENGIMLEIKCPYRRKIDGIPPLYYYIQCQLQMECCDLDVCDFIEFEFVEFLTEQEWLDKETISLDFKHQGLLIQIEKINMNKDCIENEIGNPEDNRYIYPPRNLINSIDDLLSWANKELKKGRSGDNFESNTLKYSILYWKVSYFCNTRINRDKEWFAHVLPVFEKEWKLIKYYKKNNNHKKLTNESISHGKTISIKDEKKYIPM